VYDKNRLKNIIPINIRISHKIFVSKDKGYIFEKTIAGREKYIIKSTSCFELS
jgi:hypothetical protein